jgi:hypothetical protein
MVCFHCAGGEAVDVDAIVDAAHQFAMPQCGECRRKKVPVVKGRKKQNAKAHANDVTSYCTSKARKTAANTEAARAAARQPVPEQVAQYLVSKVVGKRKQPAEKLIFWQKEGYPEEGSLCSRDECTYENAKQLGAN